MNANNRCIDINGDSVPTSFESWESMAKERNELTPEIKAGFRMFKEQQRKDKANCEKIMLEYERGE